MLEHEIEILTGRFAQQTIGARETIHLADVLEAELPQGVKAYLAAEVRRWLKQDLAAAPRFSHLDAGRPEAAKKLRLFLHTLVPLYQFRRSEYLAVLDHAVHFVARFLCKPRWTLERLVFDNAERADTRHVLSRLEYLADYRYFAVLLEKVINRRKQEELTLEEFRALVRRIDDEVVHQHSPRELAELARPIFAFLAGDERGAIPLEPLLLFLEDKQMGALREYVSAICRIRGKASITVDEFAGIAEDLHAGRAQSQSPVEPPTPPEPEQEPLEPEPLEPTAEEPPPQDVLRSIPAEPPAPEPASTQVTATEPSAVSEPAETEARKPAVVPSTPVPPRPSGPPIAVRDMNPALSLTFAGLQETHAVSQTSSRPRKPDLHTFIPEEQKRKFSNGIFRKDEEYFHGVLDALNSMHTWKEASLYLNRLYELHELDPFAPDVIAFTDIIQRRFLGEPR